MKIILVRHGHVEGMAPERFRGREDLPLTQFGRRQAEATAQRIASAWQPAVVYCSPLQRAVATAQPIADACGIPLEPIETFNDIDYGEWQGLTPAEARKRWPDDVERWYREPQSVAIPGGESLTDVLARVHNGLYPLLTAHRDDTIVLVGHSVVNRVMLLHVLDAPLGSYWRIGQDPGSLSEIGYNEDGDFTLCSMNDTAHVPKME